MVQFLNDINYTPWSSNKIEFEFFFFSCTITFVLWSLFCIQCPSDLRQLGFVLNAFHDNGYFFSLITVFSVTTTGYSMDLIPSIHPYYRYLCYCIYTTFPVICCHISFQHSVSTPHIFVAVHLSMNMLAIIFILDGLSNAPIQNDAVVGQFNIFCRGEQYLERWFQFRFNSRTSRLIRWRFTNPWSRLAQCFISSYICNGFFSTVWWFRSTTSLCPKPNARPGQGDRMLVRQAVWTFEWFKCFVWGRLETIAIFKDCHYRLEWIVSTIRWKPCTFPSSDQSIVDVITQQSKYGRIKESFDAGCVPITTRSRFEETPSAFVVAQF